MTRDDATLLDIARAARLAVQFGRRVESAEALEDDALVQSAVLHQLMVLGEAVKRLSPAFREAHPEVAWNASARMRDRLIHGYDDVSLDIVWDTVASDLPTMLAQIEPLLPDV